MAGELEVPAGSYTVSGNVGKNVGSYIVTVTGSGNYSGNATAKFRIKEAEPTVDVEATEAGDEEKAVEDVTMVMEVAEDAADKVTTETREIINPETGAKEEVQVTVIPIVLESINIPAGAETKEITVTVPNETIDGNVVYKVTEIKADAFKKKEGDNTVVTKVILPETDEPLKIEEDALKPDGNLLDVEAPLALLDDYALQESLKENFEAVKISAIVTAPNKYWTFSSGVDCILPEKGGEYEIVACPGNQESGSAVATTDANSYKGNCLTPVIVSKNYPADKTLILKDNEFHTIKSSLSMVKPCKAVFSLEKAGEK